MEGARGTLWEGGGPWGGDLVIGCSKGKVRRSKERNEHSSIGELHGSDVLGQLKVDGRVIENSSSYFFFGVFGDLACFCGEK